MAEPDDGNTAKESEEESLEYNMADFKKFLRQKGFTERDSSSLAAAGIGPKVTLSFVEACLNNKELIQNVTRAGRRLLDSLRIQLSSEDPDSAGKPSTEMSTQQSMDDSPDNFPTFISWLKHRGLSDKDIQALNDKGLATAEGFATLQSNNLDGLQLTRAGKRLLQNIIPLFNERREKDTEPQAPSPVQSPSSATAGSSDLSLDGPMMSRRSISQTSQRSESIVEDSPNSISSWLKHSGLCQKDLQILTDEGFVTAQGFETLLPEDLNNFSFTRGGKKILQRLMAEFKEIREKSTRTNQMSSIVAESLPWANTVRFIVDVPLGTSGQCVKVNEVSCQVTHSPAVSSGVRSITFRYSAQLDYTTPDNPKE